MKKPVQLTKAVDRVTNSLRRSLGRDGFLSAFATKALTATLREQTVQLQKVTRLRGVEVSKPVSRAAPNQQGNYSGTIVKPLP
jgi:hypothetical protein